jgi:hypothetical protein
VEAWEPKAILEMYEWLFERHVIVATFVADDDSSIKGQDEMGGLLIHA